MIVGQNPLRQNPSGVGQNPLLQPNSSTQRSMHQLRFVHRDYLTAVSIPPPEYLSLSQNACWL